MIRKQFRCDRIFRIRRRYCHESDGLERTFSSSLRMFVSGQFACYQRSTRGDCAYAALSLAAGRLMEAGYHGVLITEIDPLPSRSSMAFKRVTR